jgi:hypothetical protein
MGASYFDAMGQISALRHAAIFFAPSSNGQFTVDPGKGVQILAHLRYFFASDR